MPMSGRSLVGKLAGNFASALGTQLAAAHCAARERFWLLRDGAPTPKKRACRFLCSKRTRRSLVVNRSSTWLFAGMQGTLLITPPPPADEPGSGCPGLPPYGVRLASRFRSSMRKIAILV